MAKNVGRAFLIKIGDGGGPEAFLTIAALNSKSLKINNERLDATTPDLTTPEGVMWRETLAGAKSISMSGDMTLADTAAEARLAEVAMADDPVANFQAVVPGVGTWEGAFSLDYEMGGDGALTGNMSLESNGVVTFTPEA
jgi:predicted secreted protein